MYSSAVKCKLSYAASHIYIHIYQTGKNLSLFSELQKNSSAVFFFTFEHTDKNSENSQPVVTS